MVQKRTYKQPKMYLRARNVLKKKFHSLNVGRAYVHVNQCLNYTEYSKASCYPLLSVISNGSKSYKTFTRDSDGYKALEGLFRDGDVRRTHKPSTVYLEHTVFHYYKKDAFRNRFREMVDKYDPIMAGSSKFTFVIFSLP